MDSKELPNTDADYPRMVLRFPAQLRDAVRLQDGVYDALTVPDQAGLEAALADGFFLSAAEAKEHGDAVLKAASDQAATEADAKRLADAKALIAAAEADSAPPTRAELEQKATELGITFATNIGDAKLAERIAEKLKG